MDDPPLSIIVSFIVLALMLSGMGYLYDRNKQLEEKVSRFDMYYDEKYKAEFDNVTANGLAFGDYFAVWTKDRTITEVLETCTHEYAHNNLRLADP